MLVRQPADFYMHALDPIHLPLSASVPKEPGRSTLMRWAIAANVAGLIVSAALSAWLIVVWSGSGSIGVVHPMHVLLGPLHALPFYVVTLVALRTRIESDDPAFEAGWSKCLLWFFGFACLLAAGQVLTTLGLTRTNPDGSPALLVSACLPFIAWGLGLSALEVRRCFRPAWWVSAVFVPMLCALGALTVSQRFSDGFIGLFRGPIPDDFGGSLTWSIDNNDFIERMELVIVWFVVAWSVYVVLGIRRASRLSALHSAPNEAALAPACRAD